jgi:hypothetical protein
MIIATAGGGARAMPENAQALFAVDHVFSSPNRDPDLTVA